MAAFHALAGLQFLMALRRCFSLAMLMLLLLMQTKLEQRQRLQKTVQLVALGCRGLLGQGNRTGSYGHAPMCPAMLAWRQKKPRKR